MREWCVGGVSGGMVGEGKRKTGKGGAGTSRKSRSRVHKSFAVKCSVDNGEMIYIVG